MELTDTNCTVFHHKPAVTWEAVHDNNITIFHEKPFAKLEARV